MCTKLCSLLTHKAFVLICFSLQVFSGDIGTRLDLSGNRLSYYTVAGGNTTFSPFPVYDNCDAYLKEFGYYSSRFVKCTIEKARPFRFCEECVEYYQKTIRLYTDIQENDEQKDGCKNLLLNADRIQVLSEVYRIVRTIWTQADCTGCFSKISEDINGTVTSIHSENTDIFLEKYSNVTACINYHKHHKGLNLSVCDECRRNYSDLNDFFKKLRSSSNHEVCMDLVDMMNYTRLMWGKTLHCSQHYPDDAPVIVIGVILCLIPSVFYTATRFLSSRKQLKIMMQRRMSRKASRTLLDYRNQITEDDQSQDRLLSTSFGGRGSTL